MEAQMQRQLHHHYDEEDPQHAGLHSVIEGDQGDQGEHDHHEKKSVLKKVKDKAKKIKDTIKKHGHHGHEHEHEYRHDQISEEEEDDDEDEEMVNDPEVHGAPMYQSAVITGTKLPMQTGVNLEKPTDAREDRYNPNIRDQVVPNVHDEGITRPKTWPELGRLPTETRETEHKNQPRSSPYDEEGVRMGPLSGLEEDPHSPKSRPQEIPVSNYQSKVTDPTMEGGKEAEVAPLIRGFDKLNVRDEPVSKPELEPKSYTGSHDQFAPQPTPTKDQFNPEPNPLGPSEKPDLGPKMFDQDNPESMPSDTIAGKISSATTVITDKAVSAKNVVASKLGYGGQTQQGEDKLTKPLSESAADYGHIVAEKLTPVYEKVAGAGTAILSKVQPGGAGGEHEGSGDMKGADKGVSVKEYFVEKFRPGDEDKALSEVITDAFHKKKEGVSKGMEDKPPMGRVTESEEVVARLGTRQENKREGEDALVSGSDTTSGARVVDRLKEAVSSWLGKSTGIETAQHSIGQSYGSGPGGGHEQSKEGK
ncbi:hypothetical protein BUALT_Bualt06G0111600 [Buddleja alternifolia]|uniref:Low-temperature-induced 65 kDa protein-like n=1 Tax=Buddleja alternifolia TaxID=168488 RepID=A0AAV6XM79_9LAMI|nr:hypothetical protein BUALT_Bualt06G0111600 [Buddleja alternifolia]